ILSQPRGVLVDAGATAIFTVVSAGGLPLHYQWQLNGSDVIGATTSSFTLTNTRASDAGSYLVRVTNLFGSVSSSNAVLTVNRAPVASPQSVALGEDTLQPITLTGADPDGDSIAYALVTAPQHGILVGGAPNLTYRPDQDYFG